MSPEQIQRLRKLAHEADKARGAGFAVRARGVLIHVPALLDIADAYRWRPVEEYGNDEDTDQIVWGKRSHDGFLLSDSQMSKVAAVAYDYTHFLRLPKLEAL